MIGFSCSFRTGALTPELLGQLRAKFYADNRNVLAQMVCTKTNPIEACSSRKILEETHHVFTHKIETEGKPVTNQKNSGRCWLFAILNVMRTSFMKQYNLDEFEFSQAYLFFWDKVRLPRHVFFLMERHRASLSPYSYCVHLIGRTLQLFLA
jgi:bleomycin hydrolase